MRPLLISITVFCHLAFMVAPRLIDGWYQLYNSNTQHRFSVLLLSVFFFFKISIWKDKKRMKAIYCYKVTSNVT